MKKTLFTLAIALLALATQAQTQAFKVHEDGYTSFRTNSFVSWSWATLSHANDSVQKHWIVSFPRRTPNHTFFVTGEGNVYKNGTLTLADTALISNDGRINGAGLMLDNITGFYYIHNDEGNKGKREGRERRIGVSAQDVKEVLPEAVQADENGLLYVNYEALTVVLIEALKEQREEIELLRKTLEENGLMEPKEP